MTRVAVLGAHGRMGQLVCARVDGAPDLVLAAAVHRGNLGPGVFDDVDVVIDFSLPEALGAALPLLGSAALVSGTTGVGPDLADALTERAATAPVLVAANFSLGVNLLLGLVQTAAAALPDADLEVIEVHHRHKIDAPSGTALALGRAASEGRQLELTPVHGREGRTGERGTREIGYHAVRGGDVAGEHTVWLLADGERVALSHSASSRDVFAAGAVRAARWISGKPAGWYRMADVLGL